jgi:hypothetical protein
MNPRVTALLVSGISAGVGAFAVLLLLGNSAASALLFAVVTALVAAGVTSFQNRNRL